MRLENDRFVSFIIKLDDVPTDIIPAHVAVLRMLPSLYTKLAAESADPSADAT
jgi:hypothetical protein